MHPGERAASASTLPFVAGPSSCAARRHRPGVTRRPLSPHSELVLTESDEEEGCARLLRDRVAADMKLETGT